MKSKQFRIYIPIFLSSKKDQQVFMHAIINPPSPNKKLLAAAKKYNSLITKD
ncbi:type II toxin -antitoxin system TacA 1-like antitoxin [Flavihumibacter cheonanensis]|uniref:type II toxin -antitoxin system TacA 1-like antitoxin n=1 Tax=Flavihumibacter cheonanensis TaxID=1442385 RepID=UPI001EF7DB99|nr:DUF1778 domain-containing protein [Flavihumibacter cheonanensis]MCG7753837.1 DUF1778 domain-containing protein [Flavihumibacter cheonanensis]